MSALDPPLVKADATPITDRSLAEAALEIDAGGKDASPIVLAEPTQPVSKFLPIAMATALFMELLDTAALGSALPTLAKEFHTEPVHLKLALTAYLLTVAVLVPASGWLADRFGPRRVFVHALRVYLLGSVCCGLSDSVSQLVAARVLQGIGGAVMTPVARLIVVASTPRERLVNAMNAFTLPAIIGPLLGPLLSGLLLDVANWRWIFFINIPVGVVGLIVVLRIVPRLRNRHPGPFDGFGFVFAAAGITGLVVVAESIGTGLLSVTSQLSILAGAAVACALFVWRALTAAVPMLDLRLLTKPTYRVSMIGGSLMRLGIGATPFLLPLLLQVGLGWSPVRAGLVMTWMMVGSIVARFAGTYAIRRLGFRNALLLTAVLTAVFTAGPSVFRVETPMIVVIVYLFLAGFLRTAHFVSVVPIGYADIKSEEVSKAATLSTVIQQLALSFGVSLAGFTLYWSTGDSDELTPEKFIASFLTLGAASLLAIPFYASLDRKVGEHMRSGQ
jgi:EmrB/QacA subfamily drug resistance transporter